MVRIVAALAVAPLTLALLAQPVQAGPVADAEAVPRQVLDVSDLEAGARPQVPWAERTSRTRVTIHGLTADTPAPGASPMTFAPMGSGYVVQHGSELRWIGSDGTPGRRTWRSGGMAVSAGGEAVAFTGARGTVTVIDSEGDRVLGMAPVPSRRSTSAAGVMGEYCKEDETSQGCTVFVNSDVRPRSWYTSSHGIVQPTPVRQVTTVHGRWVGGIARVSDTGTCNVMMRYLEPAWRSCANRFSAISPDNRYVLGLPAYGDGLGPTTLDLLDLRTGALVRSWTADRRGDSATYFGEMWEDPEHVLIETFQANRCAIVRLGVDGSMEYAAPPRRCSSVGIDKLVLPVG
jgi:hypothetical protein